ncbi:Ras-like protein family member 10B [Bagarius yarrelli]|uniref:Ras-like protein family member 10B n=1 Tax=Bagarius yarrelli TaxID=175774 RepID=A0A556VU73_BAGYA|nr:Ras-like protein family member 10B [Bagarius yarrelli]
MVETLSIAVIGASGVGKTSIIRRFVHGDFNETYNPTRARRVYRPSVVLNGHMYELKILDVPPITAFPSNSHLKVQTTSCWEHQTALSSVCQCQQDLYGTLRDPNRILLRLLTPPIRLDIRPAANRDSSGVSADLRSVMKRQRFAQRRSVSVLVKKTWKCGYVECSSKFNWHILLLFKELLGIAVARETFATTTPPSGLQGRYTGNRCSVM